MSDKVIKGTEENFVSEVLESKIPVLVDFWADWCAPCRMTGPIVDQVAAEYEGKVKVMKFHVDECPEAAGQAGVTSIPAFMMYKNGKLVQSINGAMPLAQLKALVDGAL
jgi:thioredoxin 1